MWHLKVSQPASRNNLSHSTGPNHIIVTLFAIYFTQNAQLLIKNVDDSSTKIKRQ